MKTKARGASWQAGMGAILLSGCALTAPTPGGPLRAGTYTQIQPSCAIAYGPASANVGQTHVAGNGQIYSGPSPWGAPLPLQIGARQALGSAVEIGADVGWLDSGVELRVGTPTEPGRTALALSAGLRSSQIAFTPEERTYENRLRLEAYPDLSRAQTGRFRLLLSAGVAWGNFAHGMDLPGSFRSEGGDVPDFGFTQAIVVRPEVRLETSIGISWLSRNLGRSVAIAPWFLLRSGAPTKALCNDCMQSAGAVTDFSQGWGISLIFSPSVGGDLIDWLVAQK